MLIHNFPKRHAFGKFIVYVSRELIIADSVTMIQVPQLFNIKSSFDILQFNMLITLIITNASIGNKTS